MYFSGKGVAKSIIIIILRRLEFINADNFIIQFGRGVWGYLSF
ncbi:hypothetical protein B4079_1789 [Bacillus cereus]|nr:hypothetical protein B4079_1789 [Bacillus cereus]